jgi:hypothetical protein
MTGLAVVTSELPVHLLQDVADRIHDRGGCAEVRFEWWQDPAVLPVRWDGAMRLVPWGSKARQSRLPHGSCLSREQLAGGLLAHARPEEVVIPANYGFHRGTWFLIEEGVRGVLLPHPVSGPVVYLLVEPASNYYRNMTGQSPMMPVFVNQII